MAKIKERKKKLTIPSVDKDKAQQELSYLLIQECKLIEPLWNTIRQFVLKLHTDLPTDPATCPQKDLCKKAHSSFIYTCQKVEATQMSHM